MLVLFFTALSFGAYVARRLVGPRRGYTLAGLLGGLISSTNVTFTFARLSRHEQALSRALAIGTIGACTMLCVRVAIAAAVLNWTVAQRLLPYLLLPFAVGAITLAIGSRTGSGTDNDSPALPVEQSNPLQVGPALQMAAVFQIVLFAVRVAGRYAGEQGLLISASVLGLTDVDALTISMTKAAATTSAQVAARAIIVGILANTLLKAGLAVALGSASFRRLTAAILSAMAVVIGVSLALW